MTLDQCWELARPWYAGRMEADWRGRSPEAAEAIFTAVGLVGDFWAME